MDSLRRLFRGGEQHDAPAPATVDPAEADAAEREYELELLREEQAGLDDLRQRQLRYAAYSWEPPAQGGERRADDGEPSADR